MSNDSAVRRPLSLRIAGGVACGAMALALNHIPAPLLSSESPEFAFGGALVLFAFWRLGLVPGLLAAFIGYAVDGSVREAMFAAMVLYAVEGFVVSRLAERTRSLIVADVLYWLTLGALLDLLVYGWWMEVSVGYLLLLLVKQLINGVMNAAIADGMYRQGMVRRWIGAAPRLPRSWQEVLFDRTVPVVMVPMTVIVLLLARASFAAQFNHVTAELRHAALNAEEGADQFLQSRLASIEALARQLGPVDGRRDGQVEGALRAFRATHTEFFDLLVTDTSGIVLFAAPESSSTGERYRGQDNGHRPYFLDARASQRTIFGELTLGQRHVRRPGIEATLPIAVPLLTARGSFGGVAMGALDAASLRAILAARTGNREGAAELLDRSGRVVASTGSRWAPGAPRAADLAVVFSGDASLPVELAPRGGDSYVDRLGINPRLTLAQAVSGFPFVALVDEPLSSVHHAMIPTSLALIALMLVALLAVYAVARSMGGQLSAPLQSIGAVAEDLAQGHRVQREVLADFNASPVQEIRTLGAQFVVMDEALRRRRDADASAVQESETRYRETLDQLVQAQKMESIGRLAGGIAHDFNNLLMPILGYTDLAMSSLPEGSPARGDLSMVRIGAGRAREVVAQLLAFSRTQVLDVDRIDLAEVVAEFEPLLRGALGGNIDLLVVAEPGVVVEADRPKVEQVLMNLVINAADAMPSGGRVEVRVGLEEVELPDPSVTDPLATGRFGAITVSDTGIGMDDETRRKAFDPFFTTKLQGKGTGLGLSTAYGIVRQHRGTIIVDSTVGAGTRMRVLLPLAKPKLLEPASKSATPGIPVRQAPRQRRETVTLMVVEDEASVRGFVRTALTRAGYQILEASDGSEALVRAAAHQGDIDLLLTDVVMPGLNGRQLARRFRAARPGVRVLFMSGYADDSIGAGGESPGDADVLVKPFTPDELVARVCAALDGEG